jgi:hypothetical protein
MMDNIDNLPESRFRALEEIEKEKIRLAKAYNKRVKVKLFQIEELVWKTILPLGTRDRKFGKWSPSWEGSFRVTRIVPGKLILREDSGRSKANIEWEIPKKVLS